MTRIRLVAGLTAALAGFSLSASAQTVSVRVLDSEASRPVFGALAYLVDEAGRTAKTALTDERGRALFAGMQAGVYRVRVEMIGMATAQTDPFDIAVGTTVAKDVRLQSSAIRLEGLEVELDAGPCRVRPGGEGLLVAEVWDEARKALAAAAYTDRLGIYRYETMSYVREIDRDTKVVLSEEQTHRDAYTRTPFASRSAEDLMENGFVQPDGSGHLYYAPDASVLLSDAFLDTHCFRLVDRGSGPEGLIGLGFEPTGRNRRVPDIEGSLWLDPETSELRSLDYMYRYLDQGISSPDIGGRVVFRRMPNGTWIVPEWWIRMPVLVARADLHGVQRIFIDRYRQEGGVVLAVHEAGGRSLGRRSRTGGVEGVVTDSLGVPLPGVRIGVVGSNQSVFSDAEGYFGITGLAEGRYQIRFVEPKLERFGHVPEPVEQDVILGELSYLQHRMPSVGDVLFDACRNEVVPEGSVVLVGHLHDARGRSVAGARVRVEWSRFDANPVAITEKSEGFEATTNADGFFRFCGLPESRLLRVRAVLDEGEAGPIEIRISWEEAAKYLLLELPAIRRQSSEWLP